MAMMFPSFITRIDSYLHAWEVCSLLGIEIDVGVALEAITKDSDNTHDHGSAQISFQKGMGSNYERLEFLGDCFLKLVGSFHTPKPRITLNVLKLGNLVRSLYKLPCR